MAFKFLAAFALIAVASAGYVPQPQVYHAAPVAVAHHEPQHVLTKSVEEYDPHPQYNVAYNVHDSITGDVKSQTESRDGDVVNGEYSLIDADGYKRTVSYTSDPEHGFNAVVNRVPLHESAHVSHAAPTVVKHLTPVVHAVPSHHSYAAPAVVKTVAPVSYSAPSYHHAVSTPVAYAAPNHYKAASATYTTSNLVKTVSPVTYAAAAPSHVNQYVSSPSYVNYHSHDAQVAYAAPVNYHAHAQPAYVTPSVVKTASPSYYKSAPVAYTTSESYTAPAYKHSEQNSQYHH